MTDLFLVGDIGGTKTELALVSEGFIFDRTQKYLSKNYDSLESLIKEFLKSRRVSAACFGVAGPVKDGVCHTTNLPWVIDASEISKLFKIPTVFVLNDLISSGYGVLGFPEQEFGFLNKGLEDALQNQAIISPGTGLGEALLVFNRGEFIPVSSEGGHVDFAPKSARDIELYLYLKKNFSHVSCERVLSGPGLSYIYMFLTGREKSPEDITKEAFEKNNGGVEEVALCWFCELLGAEAGNLVLKGNAWGGVYLGGGITPKILSALKREDFMRGFLDKGRFSKLLKNVPVKVIMDSKNTLLGAAFFCKNQKK